jgi:hypothetical protein
MGESRGSVLGHKAQPEGVGKQFRPRARAGAGPYLYLKKNYNLARAGRPDRIALGGASWGEQGQFDRGKVLKYVNS